MSSELKMLREHAGKDGECLTRLFNVHGRAVFRYAYSLTHDSDLAQELAQETFLTAWSRRESIELAGDSMLGWLLVTCRYQAANHRRRAAVRATVPWDDNHDEVEESFVDRLDAQRSHLAELEWVTEAIRDLSPVDRKLAELCMYEEVSYAEAASMVGLSVTSVTKRISRTRIHLRSLRLKRTSDEGSHL